MCLVFTLMLTASVQPGPLSDLLAELPERSPAIRAARLRVEAQRELRPQVTGLPDPKLQASVQLESVETRTGPQRGSLGLSQTFPGGGKRRLLGAVADQAVVASEHRLTRVTLDAEAALKRAYYRRWYTRRARAVTAEMSELVQSGERVARTRYASGRTDQAAVLKAQVELGVLDDRARTFEELEPTFTEAILAQLDRPVDATLPPPLDDELAETEVHLDLPQLYTAAAALAPEVRATEAQAEAEGLRGALARRGRVPDWTLGVTSIFVDDARAPFTRGGGHDPFVVTVGVNLPLRRRRYRAAAQQHALEAQALTATARAQVKTVEVAIRRAYFEYTDARRKLALYRDRLRPKGRQALEAAFGAFQAGRSSFLDLLDAERTLLEFELGLARSMTDHLVAVVELERLVARSVSRPVAP